MSGGQFTWRESLLHHGIHGSPLNYTDTTSGKSPVRLTRFVPVKVLSLFETAARGALARSSGCEKKTRNLCFDGFSPSRRGSSEAVLRVRPRIPVHSVVKQTFASSDPSRPIKIDEATTPDLPLQLDAPGDSSRVVRHSPTWPRLPRTSADRPDSRRTRMA